ncbi:MAG: hypothetical protein KA190_06265 [Kofleriaceae bacterium]|nr:hypothetical protein [Kofleriaceae bacterium]
MRNFDRPGSTGTALLVVSLAMVIAPGSARADIPMVYSRCPRSSAPFSLTGEVVKAGVSTTATITVPSGDLPEMLPDTTHQRGGFVAPCDLVYRNADGAERVLYDCIGTSTPAAACAALDPAVSYDGTEIAFAVFRGPLEHYWAAVRGTDLDPAAENTGAQYLDLPGYALASEEAQLFVVDVATGALTELPHTAGTFDFGPVWLPSGRIGFTTDRTRTFGTMPLCTNTNPMAIQYASMDRDGRNVDRPSPHALAAELHPYPLADGRLLISSWQLFGMLAYSHPNAVGSCGTLNNKFHLYSIYPDGSHQSAVYGQHLDDPTYRENQPDFDLATHMSAHFLTQSTDRRIWVGEYYRGNNLGLGIISGFELPPADQEGPSWLEADPEMLSAYRPPRQVNLAGFASNADQAAGPMPAPAYTHPSYTTPLAYAGKVGHPAAAPGNQLLLTWGKGPCTTATGQDFVPFMRALDAAAPGNPACDTGIYLTPPLPAQERGAVFSHPSQLTQVVDSKDFHEFFPRAVVPYAELLDLAAPPVLPAAISTGRAEPDLGAGAPFGMIGASSILHRETSPSGGAFWFEAPGQMGHLGTDLVDYTDDELCGVRMLAVLPNREQEYRKASTVPASERLAILGEFAVRKGGGAVDALGAPDTSFKVRLPANVPYLMQGLDCDGRALNTDQSWQHVRPGELRTCNGCHVHSAAADALPFAGTVAGRGEVAPVRLGGGEVPLLAGVDGGTVRTTAVPSWGLQYEFERDVMPLLAARCVSCHGADRADAGLRLDLARTEAQRDGSAADDSTWARLASDPGQELVPAPLRHPARQGTLAKPNLSKYVRMLNARGSLLYWKAAGRRTDGRTDADYPSQPVAGDDNRGHYDVDFGPDHPATMSADELAVLARWIDLGAMWGPDVFDDTVAPTLAMEGQFAGEVLTALVVGTTDVGDGLAPASLTLCVDAGDGVCAPIAVGPAELAGVVTAQVPAGLGLEAELVASVADVAGNVTELRRTVRALANLPPPGAPGGDDGGGCCQTGERGAGGAALLVVSVGLVVGRRRRRARVDRAA